MAMTFFIECKSSLNTGIQADSERTGKEEKSTSDKKQPWYNGDLVGFTDKVYASNIKTCFIHKTGLELNEPVIHGKG